VANNKEKNIMNIIVTNNQDLQELIAKAVAESVSSLIPIITKMVNRKDVYTIEEVCTTFQVSKRHLQYLRDSGQIGYIQNGRKILFRYEDLDTFFNKNYVKGGRN